MRFPSLPLRNVPCFIGAFFLIFASLSCKDPSKETKDWNAPEEHSPAKQETQAPPTPPSQEALSAGTSSEKNEIRFLSYNLKNYLTMRRGKTYLPKPEPEIKALVEIIVRQKPDILGVCEIGTAKDLADLQKRLKNNGLDLPYSEHTGGRDKTRHLGLLSRFPIAATHSQRDSSYQMEGRTWVISRGILDATLQIEDSQLRLLGVHLKSKRPINEADQELIRQNESRLLRNHADSILTAQPETRLLVYGDFNDTISTKTLTIAKSRRNAKKHLADFYFKDSRGELWTHFWDHQDIYSRFDYVLFSRNMRDHLVGKKSYIVDDPQWREASDHRPLLLVLTTP